MQFFILEIRNQDDGQQQCSHIESLALVLKAINGICAGACDCLVRFHTCCINGIL
jgi:hypothetical protein